MTAAPVRGQRCTAHLDYGAKPWLIVSNNARNHVTADVLAFRLTTPRGASDPGSARIGRPLGGYINTGNIESLDKDELGDYLGTLSPASLLVVNQGLTVALGLP